MALDARLQEAFAGDAGTPLVASHPIYQYLARRYGLNLRAVLFEPDAFPDEAGWTALEHLLAEHHATTMLWEGEPTSETAARLREMGIETVVFDPCGNRPATGDYLAVMEANVESLETIGER